MGFPDLVPAALGDKASARQNDHGPPGSVLRSTGPATSLALAATAKRAAQIDHRGVAAGGQVRLQQFGVELLALRVDLLEIARSAAQVVPMALLA